MYRLFPILILTLTFVLNITAVSTAQTVKLSLEDCIVKALQQNLNVSIERMNPRLSAISVSSAKEKYLPQLSISANKRNTNSASFSYLDAAEQVEQTYQFYTLQYSQFVPTGAMLSVSLQNDKNTTNRRFQTINPRFGSTLTFDFSQPLLRNFGFKMNNRDIIIARNNRDISETRFKTILLETIYNVESAYWNLVYSVENLKARQQSLELARDLLERNKRSVEIGRMAQIDLQSAVAEVATREADILEAEALVKNNEDLLKTIINLDAEIDQGNIDIEPTDEPVIVENAITLEEAISLARENRPDLHEIKINIKNDNVELSYAKNQLLPELNLEASYWSPGISGTQILYQDNDPASEIIVGRIPGQSADALNDAFNFRYENWSVGLSLDIPFNTFFMRNQLQQARVNLNQSNLRMQDAEQQMILEIKTANRAVETNMKRVSAYRVARELTEQKLETEEERLRLGNSTNYDVFLFQRDLSDARSSELRAIIDYKLSLAFRDRVLGISLEKNNIQASGIKIPHQ